MKMEPGSVGHFVVSVRQWDGVAGARACGFGREVCSGARGGEGRGAGGMRALRSGVLNAFISAVQQSGKCGDGNHQLRSACP